MTAGATFGIVGPLAALPYRLAAREVQRLGASLRRGVSRRTTHAVFGRKLLASGDETRIEKRVEAARGGARTLLSEDAFLQLLGLKKPAENPSLSRHALAEQAKLDGHDLDMLAMFDAFECPSEPFSFRDLILARKYAGLIAGGATWSAIARSIHRTPGPVTSLTALSLHADRQDTILARHGDLLSELDGQMLLPISETDDRLEDLFALAEEAEEDGRFEDAAALYQRCLALDPADAAAAFNRANCLHALARHEEAKAAYMLALKLDPGFVEAWFNFAGMLKEQGDFDAARRHLSTAIKIDSGYADAIYNLATIEFETDNLQEARRWWKRYLELDETSGWARSAIRGIQYVDMHLARRDAG